MEIDKDARRELVIIYGFLLVLLSALISVAAQRPMLYPYAIVDIFIFAELLAISGAPVGVGILNMYSYLFCGTRFGLGLPVAIVPAGYILVISSLLFPEFPPPDMWEITAYLLGLIVAIVGTILHFLWSSRASRKPLDVENDTPFLP